MEARRVIRAQSPFEPQLEMRQRVPRERGLPRHTPRGAERPENRAMGPGAPSDGALRLADGLACAQLILERRPVELRADAGQHRVETEADAETRARANPGSSRCP